MLQEKATVREPVTGFPSSSPSTVMSDVDVDVASQDGGQDSPCLRPALYTLVGDASRELPPWAMHSPFVVNIFIGQYILKGETDGLLMTSAQAVVP